MFNQSTIKATKLLPFEELCKENFSVVVENKVYISKQSTSERSRVLFVGEIVAETVRRRRNLSEQEHQLRQYLAC